MLFKQTNSPQTNTLRFTKMKGDMLVYPFHPNQVSRTRKY